MNFKRFAPYLAALILTLSASVGAAADGGTAGNSPDPAQVQKLQERMLGDEGIMALIMALQNDPDMQALLADPKVLEAVQSGDFGALLSNPRVKKLLDNPQLKEIGKRLDNQESGAGRRPPLHLDGDKGGAAEREPDHETR
jgi:hypothetical protein